MAENLTPPYLRIVTELRRRIADGELAPGDRVPSTRRIAKEWHVALATATKALTVLRQEGSVHAQARVGTVVAATGRGPAPARRPRTAPAAPDRALTRASVTRAAIGIADSEGLAALSMRGVAARLGVAAMTPYRYVSSKEDLVLLMADAVYGEIPHPADGPGAWRSQLESVARSLWARHRAHPWLAQLGPLTRPMVMPNLIMYNERMLSALDGYGLDPTTMFSLSVLIYSHVQGIAVHLEREAQAASSTGQSEDEWMATQVPALEAIAASGDCPTFTRIIGTFDETGYDLRLDELFELGLTALLDGVAVLVEGARGGNTAASRPR